MSTKQQGILTYYGQFRTQECKRSLATDFFSQTQKQLEFTLPKGFLACCEKFSTFAEYGMKYVAQQVTVAGAQKRPWASIDYHFMFQQSLHKICRVQSLLIIFYHLSQKSLHPLAYLVIRSKQEIMLFVFSFKELLSMFHPKAHTFLQSFFCKSLRQSGKSATESVQQTFHEIEPTAACNQGEKGIRDNFIG